MADWPTPEPKGDILYHRRLDRTPEKHFLKLPEAEQKLISQLRQTKEEKVLTVSKLKDDIEQREKIIEEERALRKQAEDRLKNHLVDIYKSSDVNSELRERLPRANKRDILATEMEEIERTHPLTEPKNGQVTDEMVDALADQFARLEKTDSQDEATQADSTDAGSTLGNTSAHLGTTVPHDRVSDIRRHSISDSSDLNPQRVPAGRKHSAPRLTLHHPYSHAPSSSVLSPPIYSPHLPVHAAGYGMGHVSNLPFHRYLSMSSPVLYPHPEPRLLPHQESFLHPHPDPVVHGIPSQSLPYRPHLQHHRGFSVPVEKSDQEKTTLSSSNESGFLSEEGTHLHSSAASVSDTVLRKSATSDLGTSTGSVYMGDVGGLSGARRVHSGMSVLPSGVGYSSQVQLLLSQLEAQRDVNHKLQERLVMAQNDLETAQVKNHQREAEVRLEITERVSELVKEIHSAQKSKEEFFLDQVKPANQKPGTLLHDTLYMDDSMYDRSETYFHHSTDSDESDVDFNFTRVSSPTCAEGSGCSHLLKQVDRLLKVKEFLQKEMQTVIMERDKAMAKWRKAEKDLRRARDRSEGMNRDDKSILFVQQERDAAVHRAQQLEEGLQTAQLAFSLQKSLSPEMINNTLTPMNHKSLQTPDQPSQTWSEPRHHSPRGKEDTDERARKAWTDPQDKNQLVSQLRRLMCERDGLLENNQRLERQVKVLQRKLTECYSSTSRN